MASVQEIGLKVTEIVQQLATETPDRAWERIHTVFHVDALLLPEARTTALVMARWALCYMSTPKHHHGMLAQASVLRSIRIDEELLMVWASADISLAVSDIAATITPTAH